ncbi:MAG: endo-1,4-beta-xylanase [Clostridia bacterium]|nr:endo-1,4-beta-xylanase [Clostridia bacterium]
MNRVKFAYDPAAPSLCEAFAGKLKIGAAVNTWNLREDSDDYRVIRRHFNVFTLENQSKPEPVHPEENRWVFEPVDRFAAFGEEAGVTLRGHTLVWHSQVPGWFFRDGEETASAELLLNRMREHITTMVTRYRGKIRTWDVVNEVLRDEGGLRESAWYKIAGNSYIAEAFRCAHEADPDARLIINDYNLESSDAKADTMASVVRELLADGVPVHGIGLQMHLGLDTDMERLKKNVRKLASIREIAPDFKLEVTELDMSCYRWGDEAEDILWDDAKTAQFSAKYTELFRFYLELAGEGVLDTVVFWGLHDGVSWLNGFPRRHKNYPLLIGRDFELKPAFYDVLGLAK